MKQRDIMQIGEWQKLPDEARPKARFWVPGAAMEEDDLKAELRGLKERGFGGIEVVGLLNTPKEVIYGSDGWGTKRWLHLLDVMDEACAELGMSMDVANGPEWPISMPTVGSADDPAALTELTWGVLDIGPSGRYDGPLPKRRVQHEEGTVKLLHVFAYQRNPEGALIGESYTDLRSRVRFSGEGSRRTAKIPGADSSSSAAQTPDAQACREHYPVLRGDEEVSADIVLPAAPQGCSWLLFAFYVQPSTQKTGLGKYYVVDHLSRAGAEACRSYWEGVLREHHWASLESFFCDSLEYQVALDWSPEFEREFEIRRGYSILPYLPFIGDAGTYPVSDVPGYRLEQAEISDMVQQDYCETLTQCYCENHLAALEEMAEELGATVRYQVAYNKPFDEERCALYVAIPENEALGRPAMDGLKRMGAAAQLERRKRYSFECAAEFGPGYGQNFEDLLWWVKRSLMSGMNAQVLHGASYSGAYRGEWSENGFMKGAHWPGYEAFGRVISNNWNRTLSVQDCRGTLDAITRMNALFRRQIRVDCLVYRSSYHNDGLDSEFAFFRDGGRLTNTGYSYETISAPMLHHPNCVVRDGVLDPEGAAWHCLLIPPVQFASAELLTEVKRLLDAGFPVIWFGDKPARAQYLSEWRTDAERQEWQAAMDAVWTQPGLTHGGCVEDAAELLRAMGIRPRLETLETRIPADAANGSPVVPAMDIAAAVHEDTAAGRTYYAVYGYNRVVYDPGSADTQDESLVSAIFRQGTTKSTYQRPGESSRRLVRVSLDRIGRVYRLNEWTGAVVPADAFKVTADGRMEGWISLEEDEMVLLAVDTGEPPEGRCGKCLPEGNTELTETGITAGDAACTTPLPQQEDAAKDPYEALCSPAPEIPIHFHTLTLQEFRPDTPEESSFLRSGFHGPERAIALEGPKDLRPWRELAPDLPRFAGKGVYCGGFTLERKEEGRTYLLSLGDVCDTFRVWVNDTEAGFPDQVLKRVDITELVREGENTLTVRVVSNLYNRLPVTDFASGFPFPVHFIPKDYGIRETEGKRCVLRVV